MKRFTNEKRSLKRLTACVLAAVMALGSVTGASAGTVTGEIRGEGTEKADYILYPTPHELKYGNGSLLQEIISDWI